MKKMFALLVSMYLAFSWQSPVYAQESQKEVWLNSRVDGDKVIVEIQSDGNIANGFTQITYPNSLNFTKVEASNGVDMHAENSKDTGVLKMSYLAEDTIDKGIFYTITFEKANKEDNESDFEIKMENEAFHASGKQSPTTSDEIVIEQGKPDPDPTPDPTPDPKPDPETPSNPSQKPDEDKGETSAPNKKEDAPSKDSSPTGDKTNIVLPLTGIATGIVVLTYVRKKRYE